ncbi:MAG: gliding motility-associated ABC transporter ATP-binding subunit GldA [Bacteroidales bacterium]|nr:gliding motility-associated ABC transporter ATP-binding subunit GldA [Bacteroidales bacterium]
MSIKVENVSKIYGTQHALNNVSFSIGEGEIVGLLGPNGAGKSTIMKIITCFIPPTSGNVTVYGHSIFEAPLEIRRLIGYLPEQNPLYTDMYIREFLRFIAGVHKLDNINKRVEDIIGITGLTPEANKKIGQLSKGYRQRVGLAQALIHDPKILILDEPTTGLDPNQLTEIRSLIREVGKTKIVILSTHIMQEVEAVCSRAIIINHGQIVADKPTGQLHTMRTNRYHVEFDNDAQMSQLKQITGVKQINQLSPRKYIIDANENTDIRKTLFNWAVNHDLAILTIQKDEESIEQVFQELTK